ncbi:MAG: efflux RND transporter periplasmic adaptor subunit [Leptolyngbyaceae cyanobacterium bins.349]|nr:efflux RND transporter periplasmic adaptor subunit [Leptolyngbyaceae cyanobacterium bins.349]
MSHRAVRFTSSLAIAGWIALAGLVTGLAGCGSLPKSEAGAQQPRGGPQDEGPAAVDVAIARTALLNQGQEYTGTTQPYRQVSVRSQVEGQIVELTANVGDRVRAGQTLGQLDDSVLTAAVVEAEAEIAARQSEVAQARTAVSEAKTQVEEARLRLQQAQSDAQRLEQLFRDGAIAEQQVETARTTVGTARQALRSAQEQVRNRQQAITATQRRVAAQQAIAAQERTRQSFTVLTSPVDGFVLERPLEPGNLAQPGSEILTLGDFSQVKIAVQISERELSTIQVGQPVQVRLDAFPTQAIAGRVNRVSPAADPTARLIPVEVIIPNTNGRIGSGLLARVNFTQQTVQRVVIPESALTTNQDRRARQQAGNQPPNAGQGQAAASGRPQSNQGNPRSQPRRNSGTVFIVNREQNQSTVEARQVALGDRQDGQVTVLSGLRPGDRYVTRSSKALKDGAPVRLSILSEGRRQEADPRGQKE